MTLGDTNLYPGKVPAYLGSLPPGVDGIKATLKWMVRLARAGKVDTGVNTLAKQLTQHLRGKDYAGEVRVLQHFVRDRIRYVRDARDVETVQTPQRTLEVGSGDCDDKATLLAALLETIGHRTRFLAMGFDGESYSHVIVETKLARTWLPLETILPGKEPGWSPANPTRLMTAHV